jgi:hypothetical protein
MAFSPNYVKGKSTKKKVSQPKKNTNTDGSPEGYTLHKSDADGNCMYYAVLSSSYAKTLPPGTADGIYNVMKTYTPSKLNPEAMRLLRKKMVEFIKSDKYNSCALHAVYNKDNKEAKVGYMMLIKSLETLGEWGQEPELALIECMYPNLKIRVFDGRVESKFWTRNDEVPADDSNVINLYWNGYHYDWLSKDT